MTGVSIFSVLPKEVLAKMYDLYFIMEGDKKGITNLSLVNQYSCKIVQEVFRDHWNNLNTWGTLNSKLLVNLMSSVDLTGSSPRAWFIFLKYKVFQADVYASPRCIETLRLAKVHFLTKDTIKQPLKKIQSKNDLALIAVWPRINGALPEECKKSDGELNSALDIRNYINELAKKGKLALIERLDFSFLQLTDIPIEIELFYKLKFLNFSYNEIKHISKSISKLSCLESLDFSFNRCETIPDSISNLKYLNSLDLSYNKIKIITNYILMINKEGFKISPECNLIATIPNRPVSIIPKMNLIGNPLLFFVIQDSKNDNRKTKNLEFIYNKYCQFAEYQCISNFSELCKLMILEADNLEKIKEAFFSLNDKDKNLIKRSLLALYFTTYDMPLTLSIRLAEDVIPADEVVFDDMKAFYLAVRRAVRQKFEDLSLRDQEDVRKVVNLRQGNNPDLDIFDNILGLLDVINLIEKGANKVPEMINQIEKGAKCSIQ